MNRKHHAWFKYCDSERQVFIGGVLIKLYGQVYGMKKKIVLVCFFSVTMTLLMLPIAPIAAIETDNPSTQMSLDNFQNYAKEETLDSPLRMGYILIHVAAFTPGNGIRPYQGANISVRGLFYSYTGETDESGDCLLKVHTNLFRPIHYRVKVSIPPGDWLHTKRISFFMQPREVVYKQFLFIVL